MTKQLVNLQPVKFKGKLYSKQYRQDFKTEHSTATIESNPQQKGKFHLCIDGTPILEWFKLKFEELKQRMGITQNKEDKPRKGLRI